MKASKGSGRLGTRLRGKLAAAYGQRGHQNAALWYVYSPRTDKDWIIRGAPCFDHFVLTEADPTVIDVDYSPEMQIPGLAPVPLTAIVRYTDGAVQWHYVHTGDIKPGSEVATRMSLLSNAAEHVGAHFRRLDEADLHGNEQLLWNWQRVIAWMTAARTTALAPYMTEIATFLHARGTTTLGEICELGPRDVSALYAAAAFRLVQRGVLQSDLGNSPVSMITTFTARG